MPASSISIGINLYMIKKGLINQKIPKFLEFHPKIIAFEKLFCQLKVSRDEDIWSHSSIDLPFQVCESSMEVHRIGDKTTGAYTMYVNMTAYGGNTYDVATVAPIIMLDQILLCLLSLYVMCSLKLPFVNQF